MPRRLAVALLLVAGVAVGACRADTVQLGFEPDVGATYRYRYEVVATITRQVEGEAARTTHVRVTIESEQTVIEAVDGGTLVEVTLTSSDSPPRTARVVVDRAGSLQTLQELDGLPADTVELPTAALLTSSGTEPPSTPLAIGDEWEIAEGVVSGTGRLERLGVLDGEPAATVTTSIVEVLTETTEQADSSVVLDGDLRSDTSTAFDLRDGSIRRGRSDSTGAVDVLVSPPVGVLAPAVEAVVTYKLQVTTTRLA